MHYGLAGLAGSAAALPAETTNAAIAAYAKSRAMYGRIMGASIAGHSATFHLNVP